MVPYSSTEEEEKEEDSFLTTSCSLNEFLLLQDFLEILCGRTAV